MNLSVSEEIFRWGPEGITRYEVIQKSGDLVRLRPLGEEAGKPEVETSVSSLVKRGFMKDVTLPELEKIR